MTIHRLAEGSLVRSFAAALLCAAPLFAQDAAPTPRPAPAAPAAASRAPIDPAWLGGWIGVARVETPAGAPPAELPLAIVVRAGADGPTVEVSSIPAGAVHRPAIDVVADGRQLAFTLDSGGRKARLEGALAEGGASTSGTLTFVGDPRRGDAPTAKWTLRRVDLVSEVAGARVFTATLEVGAQKLPMRLALGEGAHGWCGAIDILVQGVRDFPVEVARTEAGFSVRFEAGVAATIELAPKDGAKTLAEMKLLEGTFKQGTFSTPVAFEVVADAKAGTLRRPQQPVPPFPYETREVKIAHPLGHTLAGTLSMPAKQDLAVDGRVPAVVCVTGSGPQDRDEELMGHRPFAVIADALARAGVAVLRYDDRGVAASTGEFANATTADFASDADMAVEWLKRAPGIDPARVGLLGHSEGGLIAPLVAAWQNAGDAPVHPLAFLVLIAPPGEQGGRVLTRQTEALTKAAGIDAAKMAPMLAAHEALMNEVIEHRPPDAVRTAVGALLRAQLELGGQPVTDPNTLLPLIEQTMVQITGPWMSEFIRLDPKQILLQLEIPTLALWGTMDLQVDAAANRAVFERVAKVNGAPITMQVFEGLNHLMQPAKKGTVEEYGEIDTTIDPKVLERIVSWVTETARTVPVAQQPEASRPAAVREAYVPPRLFYYREQPAAAPQGAAQGGKPTP